MGNLGAAVSQKGYDVKDSADRLKVFSSSFQTLKIHSVNSVSGSVPGSGVTTVTVTHNLGYYAPYIMIYNGAGNNESYTNYYIFETRQYTNRLEIDIPDYADGSTAYFTVYIFLDDFRSISENTIDTTDSSVSGSDSYGMRVSKGGYDVKTDADENMVLSSSFFNQIVHKKGIQAYTTGYTVSHNLGYTPNYLSFQKQSGNSFITSTSGGFGLASIDETSLNFDSIINFECTLYYIIFKDKII